MTVLVLNSGSSSLKFAFFGPSRSLTRQLRGSIDRIGQAAATLRAVDAEGVVVVERDVEVDNSGRAGERLVAWLQEYQAAAAITAIGHRIVHGGTTSPAHQLITPDLLDELERAVPLDPTHLPGQIELIRACERTFPKMPQVACFDTAFHRSHDAVADHYAIPHQLHAEGVRRYGFHGLSYEYLMSELHRVGRHGESTGRVILAHLGSGASMAAVRGGQPLDTTMAFTPASGLMMGTRPGDLDLGVLVYLARSAGFGAEAMDRFVNAECGLLGVSETSADMQELVKRRESDERASEAVQLFCRSARKSIGGLAAVLGGIDTLVFAGGIGEHSPFVRSEICRGLEFLGVRINPERNALGLDCGVISEDQAGTHVSVRVMRTDEESMIARHVLRVISRAEGAA